MVELEPKRAAPAAEAASAHVVDKITQFAGRLRAVT